MAAGRIGEAIRRLLSKLRPAPLTAADHPSAQVAPWLIEEWRPRRGTWTIYAVSDGRRYVGVRARSRTRYRLTWAMEDANYEVRGRFVHPIGSHGQVSDKPVYELRHRVVRPLVADRPTLRRIRFSGSPSFRLGSNDAP